jgi:hypothetical protein
MQYLKSLIALALNLHHERDGAFFKRRYRVEPILSNDAAVGIEQYVHQQAVKHELVERAVEWPGLCSYAAVVEGRATVEASWFDEESWRELSGRRDERGNYVRTAAVPLTPLPHRAGLSDSSCARSGERSCSTCRTSRPRSPASAATMAVADCPARQVHDAGPERLPAGAPQEALRPAALRARD